MQVISFVGADSGVFADAVPANVDTKPAVP